MLKISKPPPREVVSRLPLPESIKELSGKAHPRGGARGGAMPTVAPLGGSDLRDPGY